jgi:hypothetical protein
MVFLKLSLVLFVFALVQLTMLLVLLTAVFVVSCDAVVLLTVLLQLQVVQFACKSPYFVQL